MAEFIEFAKRTTHGSAWRGGHSAEATPFDWRKLFPKSQPIRLPVAPDCIHSVPSAKGRLMGQCLSAEGQALYGSKPDFKTCEVCPHRKGRENV